MNSVGALLQLIVVTAMYYILMEILMPVVMLPASGGDDSVCRGITGINRSGGRCSAGPWP